MPILLTDQDRAALGTKLPHWTVVKDGKAIARTFHFRDFSEAWGFMSRVALLAEQLGHHPDWANVWNMVRIELTTHDSGGLTDLDVRAAAVVDTFVG